MFLWQGFNLFYITANDCPGHQGMTNIHSSVFCVCNYITSDTESKKNIKENNCFPSEIAILSIEIKVPPRVVWALLNLRHRQAYRKSSENCRIPWIGRDLKNHFIPTPCLNKGATHEMRLLKAPSNLAWTFPGMEHP